MGALAAPIEPRDVIVVPEKAVLGSGNTRKNIVAVAQTAESWGNCGGHLR